MGYWNKSPCNGSIVVYPLQRNFRHPLLGKVMALVFYDSEGIFLVEHMQHKTRIIGCAYAVVLQNLKATMKKKKDEGNWQGASCCFTSKLLYDKQSMPQDFYSPTLVPSEFIPVLKPNGTLLWTQVFKPRKTKRSVSRVVQAAWQRLLFSAILLLPGKWKKWVELKEDYIENQWKFCSILTPSWIGKNLYM